MHSEVFAYRRSNGKFGVRNHVVILPLDDVSNTAAEAVAKLIHPTVPLSHPYGRLQFGADQALFMRTLIGTASSPNVAAAVVIGPSGALKKVVDALTKAGTPVEGFGTEGLGDLPTIERAARAAKELVHQASELRREPVSLWQLAASTKCGESDATSGLAANPAVGLVTDRLVRAGGTMLFGETSELTGAEDILAERMATPELRQRFLEVQRGYVDFLTAQGVDLLGTQPTPSNIAGGLSTIEEKALGNIQKLGSCPIAGVLDSAAAPTSAGLHFMDTSCVMSECLTLFGAAGAVLHLFTTGQGSIVGHPVMPVIKISANPNSTIGVADHIDVDISDLLTLDIGMEEAANRIVDMMRRTANGRLTAAEVLGHREFVPTKLHRSA